MSDRKKGTQGKTRTHYEVLGVSQTATQAEIKKAFRDNIKKYHPDKAPEGKMEEYTKITADINEAYGVLSNEEKRQMYDRFGDSAANMHTDGGFDDPLAQMFGNMFGGRSATRQRKEVAEPIIVKVEITLEEAYTGCNLKRNITRNNCCKVCDGTGSKNKTKTTCNKCSGSGQMRETKATPFGLAQTITTCDKCRGIGKSASPENMCPPCGGKGTTSAKHEVSIYIKKGISIKNSQIIIEDEGHELADKTRGPVIINVSVRSHPVYKRNIVKNEQEYSEIDLSITMTISLVDALCGFRKVITHLDKHQFNIVHTEPINNGDVFIIPNKGMIDGSKTGNLYIKYNVRPSKLDSKQKSTIYAAITGKTFTPPSVDGCINFNKDASNISFLSDNDVTELGKNDRRERNQSGFQDFGGSPFFNMF